MHGLNSEFFPTEDPRAGRSRKGTEQLLEGVTPDRAACIQVTAISSRIPPPNQTSQEPEDD